MSDAEHDPYHFKTFAIITYVLFLVPGGLLSVIGVIVAYTRVGKGGYGPNSHFVFQIRSFWIGIALAILGGVLFWPLGLADTMLFLVAVWFFVRALVGLIRALNNQAIPSPRSYFLGL